MVQINDRLLVERMRLLELLNTHITRHCFLRLQILPMRGHPLRSAPQQIQILLFLSKEKPLFAVEDRFLQPNLLEK